MDIPDLITMLGNLSQALTPIQHLISGGSYLLGIIFVISALFRFKAVGESRGRESGFIPAMYLLFGAGLLYLPSTMSVLANTAFGAGNVLTYSSYNKVDVSQLVGTFIRVAGLIWFIRGSVLMAHASNPGVQEGPKGLVFIIAGVLALNFDNTISMVNTVLDSIVGWAINFKISHGY